MLIFFGVIQKFYMFHTMLIILLKSFSPKVALPCGSLLFGTGASSWNSERIGVPEA